MATRTMRYDCMGLKGSSENRNSTASSQEGINSGVLEGYNLEPWRQQPSKYFYPTFGQLGVQFIKEQQGRGNATPTIKHYEEAIKKLSQFLAWYTKSPATFAKMSTEDRISVGSEVPVSIFETAGIEASIREFLSIGEINEVTKTTYMRGYRSILYYAMDEGIIRKHLIRIKTVEGDIKDCYTDEELARLLKRPESNCTFAEYRSWVVINYVLATGNRVSTIVALKIDDINFDEDTITINVQKNKHKTRLPMQSNLKRILREYINVWLVDESGNRVTEYLFPSSYIEASGFPMTRESMGRCIAEYNRSRGVEKTSIHLFRHTFAKNWILHGGDLHSLQKVLGHSTLEMVTHYANLYDTDLKPKVDAYSVLATHRTNNRGRMISRREK